MDPRVERIMAAADYIAAKLDGRTPYAGIVLGSGLGKLADIFVFLLDISVIFKYCVTC